MISIASYAALVASSFAAGAINSVAGGGTLLTFPTLLAVGIPPVMANATSTVALVPGSITSLYGYRDDLKGSARTALWLAIPSVAGALIGAVLVLKAGDSILSKLVPWLILGATVLFLLQEPVSRLNRVRAERAAQLATNDGDGPQVTVASSTNEPMSGNMAATAVFQFFVAIYGGFFGAGIGILMLAALGFMGLTNIHKMNGLKSLAAVCINLVASFTFIAERRVDWPIALVMAVGAILGGYGGAGIAKRIGQKPVRQIVVGIGFGIAALMFWRQFHGGI